MRYPEMVKTNARYRGPMESRKKTNGMKDVRRSIELLKEQMEERRKESRTLGQQLQTEYNTTRPNDRKEVINGVQSVRGGEL
jgi:hypothetical protein